MKVASDAVKNAFQTPLIAPDSTRLFHGRGGLYPGLEGVTIDYHPPVVLVALFNELEESLSHRFIEDIVESVPVDHCVVVQKRYLARPSCDVVKGELPDPCYAHSRGLRYQLKIGPNQNVGYFLDMKAAHHWLAQRAKGQRILNLFAYTCAFSVVAVQAGAHQVVNVDMSGGALKTGAFNHRLNDLDHRSYQCLKLNILKSWGRLRKMAPFDWLVIDPPSQQKGSFSAETDYAKVIRRIPELVRPGGQILGCLNAPHLDSQFLIDLFKQHCPECILVERLPGAEDFPEKDPEKGLKLLVFCYQPS